MMATSSIQIDAEKLLSTFLDMVRLDSPSGQEGLVRDYLRQRLEALGIVPEEDAAGNLIVTVPGHPAQNAKTLLITGHMDVVPPCLGIQPVIEGEGLNRTIRSNGTTVLGADDKAALSPILEALEISLREKLPRPDILLLLTTREEVMLQGAKDMNPDVYRHADFGIALDHTGAQGTVIYEAPSYAKFKMTVCGKSVHAGIMPEKGINAIKILSWVIDRLEVGRLDENTTMNIGYIKGGKATNIVPDLAVAEGEIRTHHDERLQQELAKLETALHEVVDPVEGASFEFCHEVCFEHYRTDPDHPGVQSILRAISDLSLPVNLIRTNGGSDINVFAKRGVPGVVLSAGYCEPHSLNESVTLNDMMTCTRLLLGIWGHMAC